jgi:hypothetical protein
MDIPESLHKSRPSLGAYSIKTYTSILRSLHRKVFGDDTEPSMENFRKDEKILEFLKDVPSSRRKTILSALVVLTDDGKYRDVMNKDVSEYNKEIAKQELTPSQKNSWVDKEQLDEVYTDLKRTADMLMKKSHLTPGDLQKIQEYIMLCVMGGFFIPPRRALDYCLFKIKNVDKAVDNYFETGSKPKMVFNKYKTSKTYGQQVIDIPKELKTILMKWFKVNPTEYLLFDTNMSPLNSVKVNQRLSKIFKGVASGTSVNALRHSYLTTKYGHTINEAKAIDKDMSEMGSSKNMATVYIKDV